MPQTGADAVTVPGAVAGWSLLFDRYTRISFSEILAPAIALADEGFPVAEITAAEWANAEPFLRDNPQAAKTFLNAGRAPHMGEIFRNPDLGATYRRILKDGTEGFYRGDIAKRIVKGITDGGGAMRPEDLSAFAAEWVEPIKATYRGWDVFELPPNGTGIAALMMLNILDAFPLKEYGHNSVDALHAMIEAKKLAYADMLGYVGDPRVSNVPMPAMLSKPYGARRAASIDPACVNLVPSAGALTHGGDTTYLCAADRDGNMVSLIQSNFASFGSGIVGEGTGFVLQNRGGLFTLDSAHPNVLAPRKRPLHTIIPGFMRRDRVRIAFGIMGGWNQSQAHAQFVSNVVDHGMNIQAALEAPRFTKLTFEGCDVIVEARIPQHVRAGLAERGHDIAVQGDFSSQVGAGQAVLRDDSAGVNYGASDPRKDGSAIPEPL
jgi:gamma-glutamyltranspeptidase/glutathione hydrolase